MRLERGTGPDLSFKVPKETSVIASTVAESMDWQVTGSYAFRETSHVNLQEVRALRREVRRLAACGEGRNSVLICLNDSRVVVGCVSKGRSSSYKLNGMLRAMIFHLVLGRMSLALLWVETSAKYVACRQALCSAHLSPASA